MSESKDEMYLSVYSDRFELYTSDGTEVFHEGPQSKEAAARYKEIMEKFKGGFYQTVLSDMSNVLESRPLPAEQSQLIRTLVDGITSETGRALVGLVCLQLAIKSIDSKQSIRLHKGGGQQSFSWREGISMRTLDSSFNTPFLRNNKLLNINNYGIMMTRSLAENYPYSRLYKAKIRGPFEQWVALVEAIEDRSLPAYPALCLLVSTLKNRSDLFKEKVCRVKQFYVSFECPSLGLVFNFLNTFIHVTYYSARAFEVVMHCLMQGLAEMGLLGGSLVPLSQMRSANKKHGNIGDIELMEGRTIIESWDAKYGKPYLRDELEELDDKLANHCSVKVVGFVVNGKVDLSKEITDRIEEISNLYNCKVILTTFYEWFFYNSLRVNSEEEKCELAKRWLIAVIESFGQLRSEWAPIDEPCDKWLDDLERLEGWWERLGMVAPSAIPDVLRPREF